MGKRCNLNIRFVEAAPGSDKDIRELLEGKDMDCKIHKSRMVNIDIENTDDLLKNCKGDLKEGIYELIINKMYSLVLSNFNQVLGQVKNLI